MKTYTEEEIDSILSDLQKELPEILKSEALSGESLQKAQVATAKEGGNGTKPVRGGSMHKEEGEMEKSVVPLSMEKSAPPLEKEVSEGADGSAPGEGASAPESASPEEAPAEAAPNEEGQEAAPQEGAPEGAPQEGGEQGEQSLEQAYGSLSDEELQVHYEALKAVLMQRMSAQQQQAPQAAPPAPAASPSPAPSASPAPAMPPEQGQAPMAMAEGELSKTEKRVNLLEKQLESVTTLLERMLNKPSQRAVTSMAEFVAKSELDKPAARPLSKKEVDEKLVKASRDPSLKKSDRDLIDRYYLGSGVTFKDLEHLLK